MYEKIVKDKKFKVYLFSEEVKKIKEVCDDQAKKYGYSVKNGMEEMDYGGVKEQEENTKIEELLKKLYLDKVKEEGRDNI